MSILITGGTGFLGAHLARALVKQGKKVILFEANPNLKIIEDIAANVEIVRGDIANWAEVIDAVSTYKIREIFHNAALLSENAEKFYLKAYQVNVTGTWHALEAARLFKVEKVLFSSTIGTYGDFVRDPVPNDAPQFPHSMYGATKVAAERLGEYYYYRFGLDFRGVRFPSVIGPGRGGGGLSAYTTLLVQLPAAGLPYDIYVTPETRLAVLYIDDAVNALISLSGAENKQLSRRIYNIGGVLCSAQEMVDCVKGILPQAELNFVPDDEMVKILKTVPSFLDDTLARQDWGWNEVFDLQTMVRSFIAEIQLNSHRYV